MADIFALGSNGSGQLGIGHKEDVSVPKPAIFVTGEPSTANLSVSAGGNHTLITTAEGELFAAGEYTSGACGLSEPGDSQKPHFSHVRFHDGSLSKAKITHSTATWEGSVVVTLDHEGAARNIYTFGIGNKGELGLGEFIFRTPTAQSIPDFPPPGTTVVDLTSSINHVIVVLSNGDAYGWGNGRKGQLGQPEAILHSPRKLAGIDFRIHRAVCGREFTCFLGEPGSGQFVVLGSDRWDIKTSGPASLPKWRDVGASWGSIFVLTEDGKLLSWGRNDHGQLGPANLPSLTKIAIGSEHAVALSSDGDVLAWGWGEHGNCGPGTANEDVKDRWNTIAFSKYLPPGTSIESIGAGCATSWISIKQQG